MSKFIIKVNSSSEYGQDINAAIVDVDADLRKTIEARRRVFNLAKQEDSDIYSMRYWCGAPEFFEADDDLSDTEFEGSMLASDAGEDFSYESERIECVTMVVTERGVAWTCYQKHCSIELSSDILGYDVLKEIDGPVVL
jgi:hypothetical protein